MKSYYINCGFLNENPVFTTFNIWTASKTGIAAIPLHHSLKGTYFSAFRFVIRLHRLHFHDDQIITFKLCSAMLHEVDEGFNYHKTESKDLRLDSKLNGSTTDRLKRLPALVINSQ
jgi:hypothetical protein